MNVIGLKKCPHCGFKELYGCHNCYTTGVPFLCPKCSTEMNYAPYAQCKGYLSDSDYQKTWDLLQRNLETLDFKMIYNKEKGTSTLQWFGIKT